MSTRIEIVRTAAEQPWHARLRSGNGQLTWVTENYARKAGAERAVLAMARAFGWEPVLVVKVPKFESVVRDLGLRGAVPVLYLDERAA